MWFKEISNDSDVVISTRIRYARTISGYKFPNMMSKKEKKELLKKVKNSVNKEEYNFFETSNIDEITLGSLVEEHLISKELKNMEDTAIIINKNCDIVAMVNEEDHLRIQAFDSGFNIVNCYNKLNEFTDNLSNSLEFVINKDYGYITACPSNVGAAMRVSVMVHLPALAKLGLLSKTIDDAINMGISVRGLYGENTAGYGHMYQISNQQTLGISDKDIIKKIKAVVGTIISQERKAREVLRESSIYLEDEVYRAYGILKNARIISDDEALKLLSKLRLGVAMNIVNEVDLQKIQSLLIDIQSNTLKNIFKDDLSREQEEIKRGDYIREELK